VASPAGFRSFFRSTPILKAEILIASIVFVTASCWAQQASGDGKSPNSQASAGSTTPDTSQVQTVTVPAGTRLPLVLMNPVDSRSTHDVHAQTTAPVIVSYRVVIPAGTFVQGKIGKAIRRGSRAEITIRPASLVFANGYVKTLNDPVNVESDEETAWANPSTATKFGVIFAPLAGMGIGTAIGAAAHTTTSTNFGGQTIRTNSLKGVAIGGVVGLVAGGITSVALLARSHHFYVEEGSPLEAALPQDITLSQEQVSAAVQDAATQPPPMPVRMPRAPPTSQAGTPASGPGSCSAGQEWCNGECVDSSAFINNDSNCGRCGNRCSFNESCTGTSCGCAPGYESCMGQCVSSASFISDSNNCGRCGNSCSAGESCFGGSCRKLGM
jgi:hypothetical protein